MAGTITINKNGGTMFAGKEAVNIYACITVKVALASYARCKMIMNRAYTPTNMLKFVEQQTGKKFKRGQYLEASEYLSKFIKQEKEKVETVYE